MSESKPPENVPVLTPSASAEVVPPKQAKTLGEVIQEVAPEILEVIPDEEKPKLAKVVFERTQISYRAGMLPDPAELAAYNQIIPQGADRIMKMAETQSAHRMELEKRVVTSQQTQETRGQ